MFYDEYVNIINYQSRKHWAMRNYLVCFEICIEIFYVEAVNYNSRNQILEYICNIQCVEAIIYTLHSNSL